jgi:hypothetical protein
MPDRHIPPRTMTLRQQYQIWKNENPRTFAKAVALARQAAARRDRFSTRCIANVLRWYSLIEWGDEGFKLNNNITPYLARDLEDMGIVPAGFFETRRVLVESEAVDA